MTTILETKRLTLRTWKDSDLLPMNKIDQAPRVMEFYPSLRDLETTKKFIARLEEHYKKYGYTLYAIELKETGEFIGYCGLLVVNFEAPFTPATEIGWRLAHDHWGKGYATEGAKGVLNYAFTVLDLKEIVAFTPVNNRRSQKVMEKIGMKHFPKEDFDHPKLDDGSPLRRHLLYRILRDDNTRQMDPL